MWPHTSATVTITITLVSCCHQSPYCLFLGACRNRFPAPGPQFAKLQDLQMPSMFGRKRSHSSGAGSFPPWHGTAQSLFPQLWRKKALPRRRKQRQQRRNITPHAMRATVINSMQHMAVGTQRNSTGPWYIYLLRHGVRPRHASPPKNDMEPVDVNPLKQTVGPTTVNLPDNSMETAKVNPPQEDS